ncbi:MAG: hypothetical protein N2109_04395 [Fimbriimonadales bacterium]|nr:hypothetical protein [Fimbriimonadales bacterium]
MKAGVALALKEIGSTRRFVAGAHDTDYFAKHGGSVSRERYVALGHNDTTTRDLWSAAGEFSRLLGSETVVTREALMAAGVRVRTIAQNRPGLLDEATEAWGWRGVVGTVEDHRVAAELPVGLVWPALERTLLWAIQGTLETVHHEDPSRAEELADRLVREACEIAEADPRQTLGQFYRRLLPMLYAFAAGRPVEIDTTATSELLRFNRSTCGQARFDLLRLFVDPRTRARAERAYDRAIEGSELYALARFGTGAIPFDLVIPGVGRGTIRLGNRGAVIQTPKPAFLSFPRRIGSVEELAEAIENKFGPDCVLVGKAVALIGQLAREFVFVFHRGASGYVSRSKAFHRLLADDGLGLDLHPLLRVEFNALDALDACCSWIRLPEPFRRPFGACEICSKSFAQRWREVAREQRALLAQLAGLRRPIDLIRFLDEEAGGAWRAIAREYESLHAKAAEIRRAIDAERAERRRLYELIRQLRLHRVETERRMGEHFRECIYGRKPTAEDAETRRAFAADIQRTIAEIDRLKAEARASRERQEAAARGSEAIATHERRRSIELEAELMRLSMAREAILCSSGLEKANHRPSAWWFPLVCPDGAWFRRTVETARCELEPLT